MTSPTRSGFAPLHPLEFRILIALSQGPSWGTQIVEEIERQEGDRMTIYPANLYRRVRDLLRKKLLEEVTGPDGSDPRRTYVSLTPLGRSVAKEEALRLRSLVQEPAVAKLLAE